MGVNGKRELVRAWQSAAKEANGIRVNVPPPLFITVRPLDQVLRTCALRSIHRKEMEQVEAFRQRDAEHEHEPHRQ